MFALHTRWKVHRQNLGAAGIGGRRCLRYWACWKVLSVGSCTFALAACGGDGDAHTGAVGAVGGSAAFMTSAGGMPGAGGITSGGVSGRSGSSGSAGLGGSGGAPGFQCTTNFDCPQTNCFGCPPTVCVNGRCTTVTATSTGGTSGDGGASGLGGSIATGGMTAAGGMTAGGAPSAGAGGALPTCGATSHLPQCEEYTRHTCALCDPAGCDESQLCYALTSCDSLYAQCTTHFTCALTATTCTAFQACEKCQL